MAASRWESCTSRQNAMSRVDERQLQAPSERLQYAVAEHDPRPPLEATPYVQHARTPHSHATPSCWRTSAVAASNASHQTPRCRKGGGSTEECAPRNRGWANAASRSRDMSIVRSTMPAGDTPLAHTPHWRVRGKGNPRVAQVLDAATHLSGRTPRVVGVGELASAGGASSHPAAPNRCPFLPS